ncbi:recombinase family protein [Shewanella inventionis]|uniref:recombinase family protein n=1 Tax=Shewanella inventionis TaxID=1738770 RepID=UPI001CBE35A6|nr:recombinase family protein [Shewanella inventionis]UAL42835.1 recombinase family protein [Shewanella inventionis]
MKAYIYSRISTKIQKKGDGLDRQLELTHAYANSIGLEIQLDSFQDIASGYHGRQMQGRLGVFLDAIKTGKVNTPAALVVESLDRLGREHTMDALPRLIDIINSGVEVHEVSTGVVYNREDTHKIHIAIAVMERAHNESKVKALRAKQAYKTAREKASETGKVITSLVPVWMEVKDGKIELIPERAELIKRIFQMYINGCGGGVIAKTLTSENIEYPVYRDAAHKHKPVWNEQRIVRIIKSPSTYGAFVSTTNAHKDNILYDYYPAVITIDTFNKAQQIRINRVTTKTKTHAMQNIFTSLLVCGKCGYTYQPNMSNTTRNGIKVRMMYLRCSGRTGTGQCKAKAINLPDTEYTILNWFRSLRFSKLQVDKRDEISDKQAQITQLNEQAQNLLVLVSKGNSRAIAMYEDIEDQLTQAKAELFRLEDTRTKPQLERIETKLALDPENIDLRRLVNLELQKVINKIVINSDAKDINFEVHFKNESFGIKQIKGYRKSIKNASADSELPSGWHTQAQNI